MFLLNNEEFNISAQHTIGDTQYPAGWFLYPENREALSGLIEVADPIPVPSPPLVPDSISMRQARLVLLQAGLLAAVNSAVAGMTGAEGDAARIEWEYAESVNRSSPLLQAMAATLALDTTALDALFTAGSLL